MSLTHWWSGHVFISFGILILIFIYYTQNFWTYWLHWAQWVFTLQFTGWVIISTSLSNMNGSSHSKISSSAVLNLAQYKVMFFLSYATTKKINFHTFSLGFCQDKWAKSCRFYGGELSLKVKLSSCSSRGCWWRTRKNGTHCEVLGRMTSSHE